MPAGDGLNCRELNVFSCSASLLQLRLLVQARVRLQTGRRLGVSHSSAVAGCLQCDGQGRAHREGSAVATADEAERERREDGVTEPLLNFLADR
jgi:hypothetical protein